MTGASAQGATRRDARGLMAAMILARWLPLAAAPTFAIMALLTAVLDSGPPNAFCSAAGGFLPGGMAPMYWLMAAFHMVPWLKLISRRRSAAWHSRFDTIETLFPGLDRSGDIQAVEQKR